MTKNKCTIKDIAELAGVSIGTVDRVIHKRGKVSKDALKKVESALKEMEYRPNPIARGLKNNKNYRICVLLPDFKMDPYWASAHLGVGIAFKEFQPFGITVQEYFYDQSLEQSFVRESEKAIASAPDALLMAPIFHKESLIVFQRCKEVGIYVALFNNYIDAFNTENFIGQDSYQSGKVAAGLIDKIISNDAKMAVVHINEESHMRQKEMGFKDYFKEKEVIGQRIVAYNLNSENSLRFKNEVALFIRSYPLVSAIFVTNSKAYMLVDIIKQLNKKFTVVGYDLLEANIHHLQNGDIDFLLHEKPQTQTYLGVSALAEYFLFGKAIPSPKILPIDIITSENVAYYL